MVAPSTNSVLDQPVRSRIYDWLGNRPGSNKNQVARGLELFYNTVEYHVGILEDHDVIVKRQGVKDDVVLFRWKDKNLWHDEATRILYGRSPARNVALALVKNPAATVSDLATVPDVPSTRSAIRHHLRVLQTMGLVVPAEGSAPTPFEPTQTLTRWAHGPGEGFLNERPP